MCAAWLSLLACATQPTQVAFGGCLAACARPAPDGESCLAWAALAPSACVSRHSAVDACCGAGDQPQCALSAPMPAGSPCVCRGADSRGPFIVQGSACKAP